MTLPDSLAGRDVLGRGRTGSGKTYAFLLPLVARLAESGGPRRPGQPRALVLAPTRELATQIDEALAPLAAAYGFRSRTVFGGVGQFPQVSALRKGVDVVVACPGRLEDLMGQGHLRLDAVEVTVLDEADHMADLGFLPSVKRILGQTPPTSQRMLFSATLDNAVGEVVRTYLHRPVTHEADSAQSPVGTMTHHILHVRGVDRLAVLTDLAAAPGRALLFTRTKHRAKQLAAHLNGAGVPAVELHGNLSQAARTRTMEAFHSGAAQTLVATDIAARGIHVDDIGLVVHADPPLEHKAYLHRSGRTARAGAAGTVVTIMTDDQVRDVRDLTRRAGITATTTRVTAEHPLLAELAPGERAFTGGLPPEVVRGDAPRGGGRRSQPRRRTDQQAGTTRGSDTPRGGRRTDGPRRAERASARPEARGQSRRSETPAHQTNPAAAGPSRERGTGVARSPQRPTAGPARRNAARRAR